MKIHLSTGKKYKIPIFGFKKYSIVPSKFYSITELKDNEYGIKDTEIITYIPINYCFHKNKDIYPYDENDITVDNPELKKFLDNFTYAISFDIERGIYAACCIEIITTTDEFNNITLSEKGKEIHKEILRMTYKMILKSGDNGDVISIIYREYGNEYIENSITRSSIKKIKNDIIHTEQYEYPCSNDIFNENVISKYLCDTIYINIINGLIKRYVYFKERLNISKSSYLLHFDNISKEDSVSYSLPETDYKKKNVIKK